KLQRQGAFHCSSVTSPRGGAIMRGGRSGVGTRAALHYAFRCSSTLVRLPARTVRCPDPRREMRRDDAPSRTTGGLSMTHDEFITIKEIAALLSVSPDVIRSNERRLGLYGLRCRLNSRVIRYPRAEVLRTLRAVG